MRDQALELVVGLMNAEDEIVFDLLWEELELWSIENRDEWDTMLFFEYMEKEYYDKRRQWSRCWREV
jgi:hypothetical protein